MAVFPLTRPVFGPAIRQIAAITSVTIQNIVYITITTTVAHYYKIGLVVRMNIPNEFGAFQLNGLFSQISSVPSTTQFVFPFVQPLLFDPFVIPGSPLQVPLTIPMAEDVLLLNQAERNLLPNG